jgi:KaiC/GvpD/RAD55 family RecA-like ATPase
MEFEFGFDAFPPGSVIVIAEELGGTHRPFALNIAAAAMQRGEKVVYFTRKKREDVTALINLYRIPHTENFKVFEGIRDRALLPKECTGDLCILDDFAALYAGITLEEMREEMWSLVDRSRKNKGYLIILDSGILPREVEQMIYALADGVVRLLTVTEGGKIKRFISIPKMNGIIPPEQHIPFTLNADGLLVDTRERHG